MARHRKKKRFSVVYSLNEVNTKVNKKSHISVIMLIILLIAFMMIGFVWQKIKFNQLTNELEDLRKQELALLEQREKSKAIVLNLSNDARIIDISKNTLHLTFPEYEVVSIPDDYHSQQKQLASILPDDSVSVINKFRNVPYMDLKYAQR
jgi:cell division protein FtsL